MDEEVIQTNGQGKDSTNKDDNTVHLVHQEQTVNDLMLIEEMTETIIPKSLQTVMSSFENKVDTFGVFISIVYMLAQESGFSLQADFKEFKTPNFYYDIRRIRNIKKIPYECWKYKHNCYKVDLFLGSQNFPCCLYVIPEVTDALLMTILSPLLPTCFSYMCDPRQFVIAESGIRFQNLKQLSDRCKNNLFVPLRSSLLTAASIPNASLSGFPFDILFSIVKHLDIQSFLHLSDTCTQIYKVKYNEFIWKSFASREFPGELIEGSVFAYFKQRYKRRTVKMLSTAFDPVFI